MAGLFSTSKMCPEAECSGESRPREKVSSMIDLIEEHRAEIVDLCRRFGVLRLDLFGSATTSAFDPATSDLDFVATFDDTSAPNYAERYLDFADALEALFHRPVDIVIDRSIRNPSFRQAVEATRQRVFVERNAPAAA